MRFIGLSQGVAPRRLAILTASAAVIVLGLAGCASDEDNGGTPFTQALAKNYTDLSNQADALPAPQEEGGFLDSLNPFSSSNPNSDLAKAFEDKASSAASGGDLEPEAALPETQSQDLRARLIRDLATGKTQFPPQAAAAQSNFDCWVMAAAVPSAGAMAQACRAALLTSLTTLENGARPVAPPPPPMPVTSAPVAPPPAPAAQTTDYTVYFAFDSWTLTAEDLKVITDVINSARAGGQTHITVVGHTDTSGDAAYNQKLSVRRANVVVDALGDLGARRAAIKASGVGETDLAVQTPDGVKEEKNRRTVIDLTP